MKSFTALCLAAGCLLLMACNGQQPAPDAITETPDGQNAAPFIVMDESLAKLKRDFNAAAGNVRLLFLSGPTCGICLRGLSDLNAALLGGNTDPRLRTFVVHVPTLSANASDAKNSMALIDNPYTRHYWEETGVIGRLYQEAMNMDYYAWDMWFAYGPNVRWEGKLPPEPDFWMHQLGPLPDDKYLDAEVFAARVNEMLAALPPPDKAPQRVSGHQSKPVEIKTIAQPL